MLSRPFIFKFIRQSTMDDHRNIDCLSMPPPTNPPLSDVIDAYCTLAIIASDDPKQAKTRVRNHVLNLQRVGTVDTVIYGSVARLFPDFGCPLAFYDNVALPFDENTAVATAAVKKVRKKTEKAWCAVTAHREPSRSGTTHLRQLEWMLKPIFRTAESQKRPARLQRRSRSAVAYL